MGTLTFTLSLRLPFLALHRIIKDARLSQLGHALLLSSSLGRKIRTVNRKNRTEVILFFVIVNQLDNVDIIFEGLKHVTTIQQGHVLCVDREIIHQQIGIIGRRNQTLH
jgi:hypothetical protein